MRLRRTDLYPVIRLVTSDTSPLTRRARSCDWGGGGCVCVLVKEFVCVCAGSEIIPESSWASAYGASARAADVLI